MKNNFFGKKDLLRKQRERFETLKKRSNLKIEQNKVLREVEVPECTTLEQVVNILLEARLKGDNIYIILNDYTLYSNSVLLDYSYALIKGRTKEEIIKEAEEKIPFWIEESKELILPEKLKEWEDYIRSTTKTLNCEFILNSAIEIMKNLEYEENTDNILEILLNQGHSGFTLLIIENIITKFSKKRSNFLEKTSLDLPSKDDSNKVRKRI